MGALLLHPIGSEADPGAHNPEAHDRADFAPALPLFLLKTLDPPLVMIIEVVWMVAVVVVVVGSGGDDGGSIGGCVELGSGDSDCERRR